MARAEIPFVVTKTNGDAVSGASVQINVRNGGAATIYADATSGTTISTAGLTTTTAEGRIEGWLNEGSYDMTITGTGITTYTQPIEMVRGDGVGLLAANSVGTVNIQDGAITFAKFASTVLQNILPAGTVLMWAGASLPSGFAWCDGATYNGTLSTYANLWTAIGTTWGGTGQTAFKVPDMRGRSPLGVGAGSGLTARTLASIGGAETYTLAETQIPSHSHAQQGTFGTSGVGNHSHGGATAAMNQNQVHGHTGEGGGSFVQNIGSNGNASLGSGGAYKLGWTGASNIDHLHGIYADGAHSHTVSISGLVTYTGGNQPFPLMHPWVGINFIIKL
jgi:microcystin-dependent protein